MAAIEGGYISADGHFVEPADLWVQRMDKRFGDRAPRVESRPEADYYMIDGVTPFPVGRVWAPILGGTRRGVSAGVLSGLQRLGE